MDKLISFIIPSYNVSACLPKCLDSFYDETVQDKIEVIIVDDGSQDHTSEVACSYIQKNPELYRLIRKTNGGHGSVINEGSKSARGKYFKIIDADDWIATENLEKFVRFLENCEADAVLTPFHMIASY